MNRLLRENYLGDDDDTDTDDWDSDSNEDDEDDDDSYGIVRRLEILRGMFEDEDEEGYFGGYRDMDWF